MLRFLREYPRSFAYAVLAHLALLAVLVFSLDWSSAPSVARKPAPIQAIAIDARKLDAEVERKKKLEEARQLEKHRAEQAQLKREQEKKQQAERERKAEVEKKHEAEAERKRNAEKQRKLEAERKKAEVDRQLKAEAEKKREAEAARKKAEAEKERRAEEARQKAEVEKQRKAEEARQKAEAEKQRKAEEARQKAAAERDMRERLAAEQEGLRAQRDSAIQRMIDEYGLYIKERVQRSWIRPSGSNASLSCIVNVRLIPGGEVVDVKIVRGSGNAAFDRSVEAAVFKASPLPVPPDPEVMEKFRSITFEFNPDS